MSEVVLGVPVECPLPALWFVRAPYGHGLIGFRFPQAPGVPDLTSRKPSTRFRSGAELGEYGARKSMPLAEWRACLGSLVGELDRADYHLDRFRECLQLIQARRAVGGGPSFGDFDVSRALYCESVGFLSALRTTLDVVMHMAARRTGIGSGPSRQWNVVDAIAPRAQPNAKNKPKVDPATYDATEEVAVLRKHAAAFETLNLYRNCMLHRGWHSQSFGYFSKDDHVREADLPQHNVMLVPDQTSLTRNTRPDTWTYRERRWLDELVFEIDHALAPAFVELAQLWELPESRGEPAPAERRPNVMLMAPRAIPVHFGSLRVLMLFENKRAAMAYCATIAVIGRKELRPFARVVRRTKLQDWGSGFVLVYDADLFGVSAEIRVVGLRQGALKPLHRISFAPNGVNGPWAGTLWLSLPMLASGAIYVLDAPTEEEATALSPGEPG